jgi:hypothetical protein
MSKGATVAGTVACSSAAPAIASDPRTAIFIALANPSNTQSVSYAVYHFQTGKVVDKGTLPPGDSKSVIIPALDNPQIIRIQNQSNCDVSRITPTFTYAASIQAQ